MITNKDFNPGKVTITKLPSEISDEICQALIGCEVFGLIISEDHGKKFIAPLEHILAALEKKGVSKEIIDIFRNQEQHLFPFEEGSYVA